MITLLVFFKFCKTQVFPNLLTEIPQRVCAPRKELAHFVYEMSLTGPIASSIQTDVEGREFLAEVSNGEKGFIRNDLRILQTIKEISFTKKMS